MQRGESTLDQRFYAGVLAAGFVLLAACKAASHAPQARTSTAPPAASALELVLAPHAGDHALDDQIRRLQQRIPKSRVPAEELDRLGCLQQGSRIETVSSKRFK